MSAAASSASASAAAAADAPMLSDEERQIYDRQLRVWGVEAQKRMRDSSVLLCGSLRGLACEVAKNVVLAGVGSITLMDAGFVVEEDLAANFLITKADVGKSRAESCLAGLRALNPNVSISARVAAVSSESPAFFTAFRAVCVVGAPLDEQLAISKILRDAAAAAPSAPATAFFAAESFGFHAYFFEDLVRHQYTHTRTRKTDAGVEEETIVSDTKLYPRSLADMHEANSLAAMAKAFGRKRQEKLALDAWLRMKLITHWRSTHASACSAATGYPPVSAEPVLGALYLARESVAKALDLPPAMATQESLLSMARVAGAELSPVCAVVGGILGQELLKVLSGKDEPLSNLFVYSAQEGYGVMVSA